ncbi:MAG: hypothetical protein GX633_04965, partial [Clostridiales bacterium]|nr:hypothetical protein [Clostridiales bacterium]
SLDKDYVHIALARLREKYGLISACIVNAADWEREYWSKDILEKKFTAARDFNADVIVLRIGENSFSSVTEEHSYFDGFITMANFFRKNKNQHLVITDMFWPSDTLNVPVINAARELGAHFVSIGDLGVKDENKAIGLFEHDGVASHPGDLGMKRIGERIANAIIKAIG